MKEYFDDRGIIKLTKNGDHPVENTPLYHVTWLFVTEDFSDTAIRQVLSFIEVGKIKGSRSHDNMTAILTYLVVVLSKRKDLYPELERDVRLMITSLKIQPDYDHPRDFMYIAYLQQRWWFLVWFGLTLPTPYLWPINPFFIWLAIFIFMAVKKYKIRGENKIFKTDTEILYWIRTQLPKRYFIIHVTRPFVVPLLMLKYGKKWVSFMFNDYYKESEHPTRATAAQKGL